MIRYLYHYNTQYCNVVVVGICGYRNPLSNDSEDNKIKKMSDTSNQHVDFIVKRTESRIGRVTTYSFNVRKRAM